MAILQATMKTSPAAENVEARKVDQKLSFPDGDGNCRPCWIPHLKNMKRWCYSHATVGTKQDPILPPGEIFQGIQTSHKSIPSHTNFVKCFLLHHRSTICIMFHQINGIRKCSKSGRPRVRLQQHRKAKDTWFIRKKIADFDPKFLEIYINKIIQSLVEKK